MKATTQPAKFQPIVLTLETEEEAKAIYAVLNNPKLCDILGIGDLPSPISLGFPDMCDQTKGINMAICSALLK